ncbi:hypothetical protein ACLESO_58450, partial [Pyxidicoccus sp. 3LG]
FVDRDKADPNTARLCNEVLARCLGPPKAEPDDRARALVRGLLVAERDRALVLLRSISLGSRITTEVRCACGTANEIAFGLDALDLGFSLPVGPLRCELGEGKVAEVALPTAGDQEDLFDAALTTAAERKTWLLGRLLRRYGERTEGFDQDFARGLPIAERRRLETAIDEALPDFDLSMLVRCSACHSEMRVPFDVPVFFFGELRARGGRALLRQIHTLAKAYHWSEHELLSLPLHRRLEYLLLLEEDQDAKLLAGLGLRGG